MYEKETDEGKGNALVQGVSARRARASFPHVEHTRQADPCRVPVLAPSV